MLGWRYTDTDNILPFLFHAIQPISRVGSGMYILLKLQKHVNYIYFLLRQRAV